MNPMFSLTFTSMRSTRFSQERGASLIVVMLILIVVSALGIGAAQISMMGERSARNDRDMQVAWQAAEAALMDAEFDIRGPNTGARQRIDIVFGGSANNSAQPDRSKFSIAGCGDDLDGKTRGLCEYVDETLAASGIRQKWLLANFTDEGANANTVEYGDYTDRQFNFGPGVQSIKKPRYVIEPIRDYGGFLESRGKSEVSAARYMYRVTSMGFGPRGDIQAVAQMILRP
jgi:type IV pilus assembly protein PilX